MKPASIQTRYPTRFRGVFSARKARYEPFIAAARARLAAHPVPDALRPWYTSMVVDNPQPSFMLLPLIFLAVADETGGITPRHEEYLPVLMLAMEACALMDDTVDRTAMRSERPTFPQTFGDVSSVPMLAALMAVIFQETQRIDPRILPDTGALFATLGALELWEYHHRYAQDRSLSATWLTNRYAQVTPAVAYALNAALLLNNRQAIPHETAQRFAEIFQDVDDIVNIHEQRELVGENDDIKMGMMTHPLLISLDVPEVGAALKTLWEAYAPLQLLPRNELMEAMADLDNQLPLQITYSTLRTLIIQVGVPTTLRKIMDDAHACVAAAPEELKPLMQELVAAFIDRIVQSTAIPASEYYS